MKSKLLLLSMVALAIVSCNDDLKMIGSTIQPDSDRMTVYADSFMLTAKTIEIDSIYARSTAGYLGNFYEPLFGSLKSDYMSQFYCPDNFKFKEEPNDGVIDSVEFQLAYVQSLGDTLTPMHAQVFQITKDLPKNFYTNINPREYCDKSILLGEKTYTAFDESLSDAIKKEIAEGKRPQYVRIPFSQAFGQNFYNATIKTPEHFKTQETFNKYFKGVFVTTNQGQGNILYVLETSINFFYKFTVNEKNKDGKDTTYIKKTSEKFAVTPEVLQLNQFKNGDLEDLLKPNDRLSYLKTPAGVFTQVTIPLAKMAEKIEDRILNNMEFSVKILPQDSWEYSLTLRTSKNVLLVPKDSMQTFFKERKINDNMTSFLAEYKNQSYNFGNIVNLLRNQIKIAKEKNEKVKDIEMVIVPVVKQSIQSNYGEYTTGLTNYLSPSATKLLTDSVALKVELSSSEKMK